MTVVGLDDTDSRERGMCTTYVAATIARALQRDGATVSRLLLIRLNPAVEYKTRGNAALAIHTDADPAVAFDRAREHLATLAETADERTHPAGISLKMKTKMTYRIKYIELRTHDRI